MIAPVIAVNPAYNLLLNNMTKTVLLSQLVYWDGRKSLRKDGELWFAKTSAALAEEIGHGSAKSVGDWLRDFKAMGLIRIKRGFFNGINQLWIQVSHDKLAALLAEFEIEHTLPQADTIEEETLPQRAVTHVNNLPQTDSPTAVSYPTGNCISKITSQKINDHRDDDDFSILTQAEIDAVTQRVTELVNSRKFTTSPIRSPEQYLRTSLKNEAEKKQTIPPETPDTFADLINRFERFAPQTQLEQPKPKSIEFPTDETWDAVMARIAEEWDEANFSTWLGKTHFFEKDEEQYVIAVPNAYICDMLQYRLYDDIKTALCEITQRDFEILFEVKRY